MQKRNILTWKGLVIAPLGAALLVAGCGDDNDRHITPAPTPLSGKVIQGPVSGATVFADLPPYNRQLDAGEKEADGPTGTDGSFTFTTPPSGDYLLVTAGGKDELTNEPAYPSLAPKGARNITPLTTMVALAEDQEAVKTILNDLAGDAGYDLDLSNSAGVAPEMMKVAKSLESALKVFADLGVTSPSAQRGIIKETAKQLVEVKKASPSATVETLLENAVAASAASIAANPAILVPAEEPEAEAVDFAVNDASAFQDIFTAAVIKVNTAITNAIVGGVITENKDLQTQVTNAVNTAITDTTNLGTIINTVSMKVSEVRGYAEGATTPLASASGAALDSLITVPSIISALEADLSLRNDFAAAKSYSPVSLVITVDDNNSERQAIFTVSSLSVNAAATGGGITVSDSAAKLTVVGRTAAGDVASNVEPYAGPFSGFTFTGNTVRFDLDAIGDLILSKSELGSFANLNDKGTYTVTIGIQGAPVASRSLQIEVQ